MLKKIYLSIGLGLSLGLVVYSDPSINYYGDITDSQHSTTVGTDASTTGASADVNMEYILPQVIAVGIYSEGDIATTGGAPLLNGRYNANSNRRKISHFAIRNKNDVLNDLVKHGNEDDETSNTESMNVNGVVYASTGIGLLTIEPVLQGGTTNIPSNSLSVRFNNQTNTGSIDVAFKGTFEGQSLANMVGNAAAITNAGNTIMDTDNRGNFSLTGDVIEETLDTSDDVGLYRGELRLTITSL
jgi:hypothetical protein